MTLKVSRLVRRLRIEPWQRNLYTIVFAETVAILGFSVSSPFLPFYIEQLGVTDLSQVAIWVGLINSLGPVTMALTAPIWGMIADRHGRKPMLVRAMLGGSLILTLIAVATSVGQVAILRILQGALTGTISAAVTLVVTSVPRERCGYSLGLLQTGVFVGTSLGPFMGGLIGGSLGYRAAFLGSGILLALAGVLVILLVRESFRHQEVRKQEGNAFLATLRTILAEPVLFTMLMLLMMVNLSGSVTGPVLPLFVQTLVPDLDAAARATGLIVGATAAANAVAAIWVGRSADRIGRRRLLLLCISVGSLIYFPQMFTRDPLQLLVLRVVLGLAMGGISPVANALIAERAPEGKQGGVYGVSTSLNAVGNALGPLLGTFVVMTWSIAGVFPVTGVMLAGVVLLTVLTTRRLEAPGRRRAG